MAQSAFPPWGALPAEQYLIRNWDTSSNLSTTDQRRSLISAFLALSEIPATWDSVRERVAEGHPEPELQEPTTDFTERVLIPWRPSAVRSVVATAFEHANALDYVWLRTHYGEDTDEQFAGILDDSQLDPADNDRILDDQSIFSVSDGEEISPQESWARALLFVPELASPSDPLLYSRDLEESLSTSGDGISWITELRRKLRSKVEAAAPQDRETVAESSPESLLLQSAAFVRSVVVVDSEAFETGEVCVLLTDVGGNVVRWFRITAEDVMEPDVLNSQGRLYEAMYFQEGERAGIGAKYRSLGEMGRVLYQVSDLIEG